MADKKRIEKILRRDPERTRGKILAAALEEFAAHGFAGARVDEIARRAKINKRMLYHYYADKDGLFRAVLREKIRDRATKIQAKSRGRENYSGAALWFEQNCEDADWVRLLAWESLQADGETVLDEQERRGAIKEIIRQLRLDQADGRLRDDVDPSYMQLAKVSLSMFPFALPQITRLITGNLPQDPKFQKNYAQFLDAISIGFCPTTTVGKTAR
jgi:AcrR family transcriptional regulator